MQPFPSEVRIRSTQVYRALTEIPNRYTLCMTISKSVRIIHQNGNRIGGSVTNVFAGIEHRTFGRQTEKRLSSATIGGFNRAFTALVSA